MATLQQIDCTKALSFCAYKAVKVTEPEMVALAAKMDLPQMLIKRRVGKRLAHVAAQFAGGLGGIAAMYVAFSVLTR